MASEILLTYWKKSLEPFKKGNLKLYLLGSLATWLRTLKSISTYFWWLVLIKWIVNVWVLQTLEFDYSLPLFVTDILFFYVATMGTRPSIEIKSYRYYGRYTTGILLLTALSVASFSFFVVMAFMLLFFLDSDLTLLGFIKSVEQTLKTLIFFAPACALFATLSMLNYMLVMPIMLLTPTLSGQWLEALLLCFSFLIYDLLFLLTLSGLSVYYIKLKHEHFDFLFE